MTDKEKEAIETMQHWIEYEKANKEKINKADELIEIQEIVLNLIQTQQEEIEKKDRIIEEIIGELVNNHCSIRDIVEEEICDDRCIGNNDWTCFKHIKEYFINKVEKESKDDN